MCLSYTNGVIMEMCCQALGLEQSSCCYLCGVVWWVAALRCVRTLWVRRRTCTRCPRSPAMPTTPVGSASLSLSLSLPI